jgi:hypothetical protein
MGDSQRSEKHSRQQKSKNSNDEISSRKHMPQASPPTEVEQHQSQHEVVEPTSQLEAVFVSLTVGVIVYDLKGRSARLIQQR